MSDVTIAVTNSSLESLLQNSEIPVLLDLWAPWCQPCLRLAPLLEKMAPLASGKLIIAKLDVDQYPDVAQTLRVRGIPSLLLFSNNKEISRKTGVDSLSDLKNWLNNNGVVFESEEDEAVLCKTGQFNSFYGDAELATFFSERLQREAAAQHIASYWQVPLEAGKHELHAVLAKQNDFSAFENMTGIPAVLGKWLHFLDYSEPEHANQLAMHLTAGKDFSKIPLQLVCMWLENKRTLWDQWLENDVNQLRLSWLTLTQSYLKGETTLRKEWDALHKNTQAYLIPRSEVFTFSRYVAMLLDELSPPVSVGIEDTDRWGTAIYALSEAQTRIEQFIIGWSEEDMALPQQRYLWICEQLSHTEYKNEEDAERAYQAMFERWSEEHSQFTTKEKDYYQQQKTLLKQACSPLQEYCLHLLNQSPVPQQRTL